MAKNNRRIAFSKNMTTQKNVILGIKRNLNGITTGRCISTTGREQKQ
tara:strand:+ start:13452 stop:13592 length:141 start_codon:yes stop_codon:yes gene_type:complete